MHLSRVTPAAVDRGDRLVAILSSQVTARGLRVTVTVTRPGEAPLAVWWEVTGSAVPVPPERADAALCAALFTAMRAGRDLHVAGPVSASLLASAEEFVQAWTAWRPDLYRPIGLSADRPLPEERRADDGTAVLPFSGGLDSTAVLLQNLWREAGHRSRRIAAAVTIHGFDIALADTGWFDLTAAATGRTLDAHGVAQAIVRTNWREAAAGAHWENEYFAGMAAVLHLFRNTASAAIIARDDTWRQVQRALPWGSNFATNPLLGTPDFPIRTTGPQTAIDAAAIIGRDRSAHANLRVCYAMGAADVAEGRLNCGRCMKCLRRQLQFIVAGHQPGPAFPEDGPEIARIRTMPIPPNHIHIVEEIAREAAERGVTDPRVAAIRTAVRLNRLGVIGLGGAPRRAIAALRRRAALRTRLRALGLWRAARRNGGA